MALIFAAFIFLLAASIVSSEGDSKNLHALIRKALHENVHDLEEARALDGCIGKETVILPTPINFENISISSVWIDGFLHFETSKISGYKNKVLIDLTFPEILASAHVAPGYENGTMLMMDFYNHHVLIEIDLDGEANGTHTSITGFRIIEQAGKKNDDRDTSFNNQLRQFIEGQISRCSSMFAEELTRHLSLLLRSIPNTAIHSGSAHPRSARKPRQTSQLNRIIDQFLRSSSDELYDELASLALRSFRLRFRRLQLGGPNAGSSLGVARFYSGNLRRADQLRRYRNVRSYTANGRWYVRVALRLSSLEVRYRGLFRERNGTRERDDVFGRIRSVRMLWLLSQDSSSSGATKVENIRVTMVTRPRFNDPDLSSLQYAWDNVKRRVENRVREYVRRLVQIRVEETLRNLVEGADDDDDQNRSRQGTGRQLFNL